MSINEEQLKQTMATTIGVPLSEIEENSSIDTIEKWDSLKHMNLILALETVFDVSFTDEESVEILNYEIIKATLKSHGILF